MSLPVSLGEWEARFAPQVRGAQLRLLGELEITDDERRHLGQLVGLRHNSLGRRRALAFFRRETPNAYAVFLVAQGIFGYSAHGYWSSVEEATGLSLDPVNQTEWGQTFEEILDEFGLPLFPDMGGSRYVSVILAHGGIPSYSLPDFFLLLLHPAVTRPQYTGLETSELIEELLHRSSVIFADKPVSRFLQYGGRVAENFFERCCAMALEFLETGLIPEATELGLPSRVVAAYREWVSRQENLERRVRRSDDLRLRKPVIIFDPWGLGVTLYLPPQLIPVTLSQADFAWDIRGAGLDPRRIRVRVRRTGVDLRTSEVMPPLRLDKPAERYEVSFLVDNQPRRTWYFEGLSPARPMWLFDPADGHWMYWSNAIPAQRLWLLYPADDALVWQGAGQAVDLPECFGSWANYLAQEVDLTQMTQLRLQQEDKVLGAWPVRSDDAQLHPHFVGGTLLQIPQPTRRTPLYLGQPPVLRIPLTGKHTIETELTVWRLTIHAREAASPALHRALRLTELKSSSVISESAPHADVPLAVSDLLGLTPYGTYDIRFRGPLGRDAELPLRVWPHLVIQPLAEVYLPHSQEGPAEVAVHIDTDQADQIECPKEEGRIESQPPTRSNPARRHTIWANPETTLLRLTLVRSASSGEIVSVPLEIPIPRVRWLLMDEASSAALPEWNGSLLWQPLDALLQMGHPSLLISLPIATDQPVEIQLRLQDIDGKSWPVSNWIKSKPEQQQWRFSLTGALDTLRASHAPVLRFELACAGLSSQTELVSLPVLSVTQALRVEKVTLQLGKKSGQPCLRLTWREPSPALSHRHVRLWPVWQPWRAPIESDIPDAAQDQFDIPVSLAEMSGRFRVQFTVEDPWLTKPLPRQMPSGNELPEADLMPPPQRLLRLDQLSQEQPEHKFQFLLEQAHIYAATGNLPAARHPAHWCEQHLGHGTIQQALALYNLLESLGDKEALQTLVQKLFTPDQIHRLAEARARNEISSNVFEEYLSHLPRADMLPVDICLQLLDVNVDTVQWAAIQQLIQFGKSAGVTAVLERVKQGKLSEADALALLAIKGEFAATQLEQTANDELAVRLLMQLAPQLGERVFVVTVGAWIHTNAGWGRIEQILDPDAGQPVNRFLHTERRHHLNVTLRPSHDAEPMLVCFPDEEIRFVQASKIYTCTKCRGCAARDPHAITGAHERAAHALNEREAYTGIGGSVTPEPEPVLNLTEKQIRFARRAPSQQWA